MTNDQDKKCRLYRDVEQARAVLLHNYDVLQETAHEECMENVALRTRLCEMQERIHNLEAAAQVVLDASAVPCVPDATGSYDWWYARQIAARGLLRETLDLACEAPSEARREKS